MTLPYYPLAALMPGFVSGIRSQTREVARSPTPARLRKVGRVAEIIGDQPGCGGARLATIGFRSRRQR